MNKLIRIFCCLIIGNLYSQDLYYNIENFKAGTTLVFQTCKSENFDVGKKGKDIIWDFSDIEHSDDIITQVITSSELINESKEYPSSNLVEKYSDGSYVFLKSEEKATYVLGFVDEKAKVKITYPNPVLIAKRPIGYDDKITEEYTTLYSVNGLDFSGKGEVTIEADGVGTLILPNKKYERVIRIKITQQQIDLLEQYNSSNETSIITYVWFDSRHTSALLKATETKSKYHNERRVEYLLKEK